MNICREFVILYQKPAKYSKEMIGKTPETHQLKIFETPLLNFINPNHELVKLAQAIDWNLLEKEFEGYFSEVGRPSVPIRKMVGLMLLKSLYNLSDEIVVARWIENPYYQHFTGEYVFQYDQPMDPADFSKFRKRIGADGAEKLLALSIHLNKDDLKGQTEVMIDSTVQEKNITFPTDVKLYRKIIERCHDLSKNLDIKLRQSYVRELKDLYLKTRFMNHPKRKKEGNKARRRIRTIGRALVNDLTRKIPAGTLIQNDLKFYMRVLNQERNDTNKIYSLHEPEVRCIAKGKEATPYEFGNKSGIAKTQTGVIVGALAFKGNPFDGHTLPDHLEQIERLTGKTFKSAIVDRGYRGRKWIGETKIEIPDTPKPSDSYYKRSKARKKFRQRAGIEPVIGHLKHDHRMERNFLKGVVGDSINTMMAATGYNLRHWIRKLISVLENIIITITAMLENCITNKLSNLRLNNFVA